MAFQKNYSNPFKLFDGLVNVIKTSTAEILHPTARVDVFTCDDFRSYLDPNMNLGYVVEQKLKTLKPESAAAIKTRLANFVLKLLQELKSRLLNNYKTSQIMQEFAVEKALCQIKNPITPFVGIGEERRKQEQLSGVRQILAYKEESKTYNKRRTKKEYNNIANGDWQEDRRARAARPEARKQRAAE